MNAPAFAGANGAEPPSETAEADEPTPREIVVTYGFWIFLLSDIIMFSALFAAYAVLSGETAGGPSGRDLFDLRRVALETAVLLTSSFTCGLLAMSVEARNRALMFLFSLLTFGLGGIFLTLEIMEFSDMIAHGAGPSRSAFLSAFFTLTGAHGLHVAIGLVALLVMTAQVATRGFRDNIMRRLHCFSLYWHALDIIWVALFSIVYLMGAHS